MSKATVLQRVGDLSFGLADQTACDRFYDECVLSLHQHGEWCTEASLVATTDGTATYTIPAAAGRVLAAFYDDQQLSLESAQGMERVLPAWRDEQGGVQALVVDGESDRTFRLWRTPEADSRDFSFIFGSPLGLDFPGYAVVIVHTDVRADQPAYLELPIAFFVLEREFLRESDHRDPDFAQACREMGEQLLAMVA